MKRYNFFRSTFSTVHSEFTPRESLERKRPTMAATFNSKSLCLFDCFSCITFPFQHRSKMRADAALIINMLADAASRSTMLAEAALKPD